MATLSEKRHGDEATAVVALSTHFTTMAAGNRYTRSWNVKTLLWQVVQIVARQKHLRRARLMTYALHTRSLHCTIIGQPRPFFAPPSLSPTRRFICEGFCRKLQIEPEDILGQPLSSIVDPRDTAALQNVVLQVLGGGGGGGGEVPPVATNSNR